MLGYQLPKVVIKMIFILKIYFFLQKLKKLSLKSCVRYISASLFFKSKRKQLSNYEKCFLLHFKSFFRSRENQILEFYIFKFHDVIKCLRIKQEIHFTE